MSRVSVLSVNAASGSEPRVRLADLVAALSLGVDLGFGQPMEHVLRQCMIALRLAETVGLDEDGRSVVYYTALLVNVGCHSDAHEQAKWFGDDIALAGAAGAKVGLSGLELVALRRAGVVHGWGRWACPTPSGTSEGRSGQASGNGCVCTRISPSACCVNRRCWRHWGRSPRHCASDSMGSG